MHGRPERQIPVGESGRRLRCLMCLVFFLIARSLLEAPSVLAETRIIHAEGEYRMGDRDTREDAVRQATEMAKRNALEQVATYLESVTVVDGMDVTKDEIHTYTAGLVLVLDQQINTTLDGEIIVVKVDLVAQIDTDEVSQAIAALRENEEARVQLVALTQENEQLQHELDAANQALADASTADQAQHATQQRREIMNRVQSNAMVSQVWTDWVLGGPVVYPHPLAGIPQSHALLDAARGLYPGSPHVVVAQQVMTTRQPPVPPSPPAAPAPGSSLHTMPSHEMVPPPGGQAMPRTLNEITHTTLTAPPRISHQPGSRTLTDVHQLNPLLPPSNGLQQPSRSLTRMQQFLQQKGSAWQPPRSDIRPPAGSAPREGPGAQSPAARRWPPAMNQVHPPALQPAPRPSHRVAPPTGRQGGQEGGSGGRSGGSRGGGSRGGVSGGGGRGATGR